MVILPLIVGHNLPVSLILAATPIGNLDDASPRLRAALANADVIAAEDTRKALNLISALGIEIRGQVISHFDANEQSRIPQLLAALQENKTVVVISDAGMPTVSDPGFRIVQAASEAGIAVTVIPGPSAVTTALAVSGLPTDRFTFEGFLSRKAGERKDQITTLMNEARTMVFFESGQRIADTIADMISIFGPERKVAMCRELTKTYEEITRGTLTDVAVRCTSDVLGEVTLVVAGVDQQTSEDVDVEAIARDLLSRGMSGKTVVAHLTDVVGMPKREAFDLVVRLKPEK
jgi:16S rRNA (cytidine1402-2'-O)-methyltransferase